MKYLIGSFELIILLVLHAGCDHRAGSDGTIALHLTIQNRGSGVSAELRTYLVRARTNDELVPGLRLDRIINDTTIRVGFDMTNVRFAYQDRPFDGVKDSVQVGLHDISFSDNTIDAQTIWRLRVDTTYSARRIADCDSMPCWIETTKEEDPNGWTFTREWYRANGSLSKRWTEILVNGRFERHGMWRTYHPEGRLSQEIEFNSGNAVGLYRKWHPNGVRELEGRHVTGRTRNMPLRHGDWTYWDSTGRECGRGVFTLGTGRVDWWYADSSPWKLEFWKDGKGDSVWYEWYQSGAVKIVHDCRPHSDSSGERLYSPEGRLDNGARDWYANGQMRKENGREFYREWYPDGTKKVETERKSVLQHGRTAYTHQGAHTEWHSDGSILRTGQYEDGRRRGLWTERSRTGIKLSERLYKEPDTMRVTTREVQVTNFHTNGQSASRGMCEYSSEIDPQEIKVGSWEYWNETGDLIRTEEWASGIILYVDGVRTIP